MVSGPHSASHLSFMMSGIEPFRQPPPAHMGIPVGLDLKTGRFFTLFFLTT